MKLIYIFLFSILITSVIFAQIPRTISYQGVLTDEFGNPKPDGDYYFIFMLYETSTGGDTIWSESKTLNVSNGLFSTSLGEPTPFGAEVKFDKPYWLGIKVGTDPELSPRIALTSSGYSLTSDNALNIVDGKVVKSLNNMKDNITMEGAGGTTVTTNGNTIVISSTGSGGSGIQGVQNTNNTIDIVNPNGPTATINLKVPLSINGAVNTPDYLFVADVTGTGGGIIGTSTNGLGVVGQGLGTSGINYGIAGNSSSPDGFAVSGWNTATTGNAVGVIGRTNSPTGIGIQGFSTGGRGVWGSSETWQGVYGFSQSNAGIVGESNAFDGVYGVTNSNNFSGVSGHNNNGGYGVYGETVSGSGVFGISVGAGNGIGVSGVSNTNFGVIGTSTVNVGVYGTSSSNNGVYGVTSSNEARAGVVGVNINAIETYGALGYSPGGRYIGVFGHSPGGTSLDVGGFFHGAEVLGRLWASNLYVSGEKDFQIDHPLNPANEYLFHSCVESSERMNIYNGNITTDANGSATVELPGYFETLNIDYRYQLTVIGQFAQAIIENEISNNRFTIRTDKPNVKVSWQVTGIRNDEYAKQHPFVVEKEKEEFAKGKYLMPELFGKPKEMGIHYVNIDETIQQPKGNELLEKQKEMKNDNN